MAYTTIDKPTDYFNTKLYTGNGSTQSITGVGFQPDWCWFKMRSHADNHVLIDSVRGTNKAVYSDLSDVESTQTHYFSSFDSDGFSLGNSGIMNASGRTYASWNWKAGGSGSSNTDGSITSTVSVNTTSGFSIVSFTGNATSGATVGHGLGSVPKMIIVKNRIDAQPWWVYHSSIGAGGQLRLEESDAKGSDGGVLWNSTEPTSSVFTLGDNGGANGSGDGTIAYCFAEKKGYSKFSSYIGNGNSDGTFIYTGFKPAFLLIKKTNEAKNWFLHDNKRLGYNPSNSYLNPNLNVVEQAETDLDILSNGYKMRSTGGGHNQSGHTYIYMAFAENPFVTSTGIPTTAR